MISRLIIRGSYGCEAVDLHYTAAISTRIDSNRLTFQGGFCLNCEPHQGQSSAHVLSPSVGLGCPLSKTPYTRGSARPFESERNCWLR